MPTNTKTFKMYALSISVFFYEVVKLFIQTLFKVNNKPEKSAFYSANAKFVEQILKGSPTLSEPYKPMRFWGYSGAIQTIFESTNIFPGPLVNEERFAFRTSDGGTITYDFYKPCSQAQNKNNITLAVVPGAWCPSKSPRICRLVKHAQINGYRAAVLNHAGVLENVPITSPRIFNVGNTSDYDGMIRHIVTRNPNTKIICIGYSVGGNIVTKYLGERESIPQIIAGIAVCQSYDCYETCCQQYHWENIGKFWFYALTSMHLAILQRWRVQLFSDEAKSKGINEDEVFSAQTLIEIDDVYSRKLYGYDTVEAMHSDWSCNRYWQNITVPIVFINATDDPMIHPKLVEKAKVFVNNKTIQQIESQIFPCKKNRMLIEQKHGGHLAFYEGGFWKPNPITWLDRTVIGLSDSLCSYMENLEEIAPIEHYQHY